MENHHRQHNYVVPMCEVNRNGVGVSRLHARLRHCVRARARQIPTFTEYATIRTSNTATCTSPPPSLPALRWGGYDGTLHCVVVCIALYIFVTLLVPDSSSLVVPVRHDHRRRSQPVRKHADDASPGAELQDRFPGQVQLGFSRAGGVLLDATALAAVGAMLHEVGAQQ